VRVAPAENNVVSPTWFGRRMAGLCARRFISVDVKEFTVITGTRL
jgi:hypothetical protein